MSPVASSAKSRVILGLDPGLAITGYGIVRIGSKVQLL